jgi:hypothetical protein
VAPRPDGVGGEPSPNRGAGNLGDEAAMEHLSADIWDVQPRQGQAETVRELARDRLDFDDDLREEKTGGRPCRGRKVYRTEAKITCSYLCWPALRKLGPSARNRHR